MDEDFILFICASFILGSLAGISLFLAYQKIRLKNFTHLATSVVKKAESDAKKIIEKAHFYEDRYLLNEKKKFEEKCDKKELKLKKEEDKLNLREDKLEKLHQRLEKKSSETDLLFLRAQQENKKIDALKYEIEKNQEHVLKKLELVSTLDKEQAKNHLLDELGKELQQEISQSIKDAIDQAKESAEKDAKRILATTIGRLATSCTSEFTTNTVQLPNPEMKGRIIGREGKNIRMLERLLGVNFIIDDTPYAIVISCFDPVRLYQAKTALIELVNDGRIHPTRIEEVVQNVCENTEKLIIESGRQAADEAKVFDLPKEILNYLGALKFRFSLGQNVLAHSVEVAHIMKMLAAELGLDQELAKKIGLLHDIGKATTHEEKGAHALIGRDLVLKYGLSKEVANGVGCHHFEIEAETIEASLCSIADAISASRPGARQEAAYDYIKRLENMEKLAMTFKGVEKAYALQAGRELRLYVSSELVDDNGVLKLARDVSKHIEKNFKFPGKIKISVTREKRVVNYLL